MAWRDLPRLTEASERAVFRPPADAVGALCVLASGSSGNCSVLVTPPEGHGFEGESWRRAGGRLGGRIVLIDAGLSPLRTRKLLAERGIRLADVDDIVLTHLDRDHFHYGWRRARDVTATLRYHARHNARAEREAALLRRNEPFRDGAELGRGMRFGSVLMEHDTLGVAALRFDLGMVAGTEEPASSLGFATDLGSYDERLVSHLAGVDVLAIESNYCPVMQAGSARPEFLKRRITGGAGHLSNEECLAATRAIGPKRAAVFLHLSRECNRPELVESLHDGAAYERVLSGQFEPTGWVWIRPNARALSPAVNATPDGPAKQMSLFAGAIGP